MRLLNKREIGLRTFYMAHRFMNEFGIRWLPVNPEDIIDQRPNWHLKYVHQIACETGVTEEHILRHVMRSQDGMTIYDMKRNSYDILINAADDISEGRMIWTKMHEIAHIYLGHLEKNSVTELREEELGEELYDQLEFEADLFTAEVLASKWLMREIQVENEKDISEICGITDIAALHRYHRATEEYNFVPANIIYTLHRFEDYLKEITLCADRSEIPLGHLAKVNPAREKFRKPMAPFLRKPGVCPWCGQVHENEVKFCRHCGSPQRKGIESKAGEFCWNRQHEDAAFCEQCGNRVLRIRQGLCFEECEL